MHSAPDNSDILSNFASFYKDVTRLEIKQKRQGKMFKYTTLAKMNFEKYSSRGSWLILILVVSSASRC